MASTQVTKEAMWYQGLLKELGFEVKGPVQLYGDNQGAIALAKNPTYHARSKHIDVQYHFVRQKLEEQKIQINYIPTEIMPADGLTKALGGVKHLKFCSYVGLRGPSARGAVEEIAEGTSTI